MRSLKGASSFVVVALEILCAALLVLMLAAIGWQIFTRFVLQSPTAWAEEFTRFSIVWITMLGSAALMRDGDHIAITIVFDILPAKIQRIVAFFQDFIVVCVCGFLGYYGFLLAEIGERQRSPGLGITMDWPYIAIPLGAALIALVLGVTRLERRRGGGG